MEIIVDTRERNNIFTFSSYGDVTTISRALKTGDYSINGFENKISIDRKETIGELYTNIGFDRKRFDNMLGRMSELEEAYIICCFPYGLVETFPYGSNIPKSKWPKLRITSKYIKKCVLDFQETYNIKIIFANSNTEAEHLTYSILKDYYDRQINS